MQKLLFFILILACCFSCAKNDQRKVEDGIDQALSLLSNEKCDDAIKLLEEVGRQTDDAIYLQVLASGYACRAGYNLVDFISNDVPSVDSANLMKSLTMLTLSSETTVDSDTYSDIKEALSILQTTDKQTARTAKFGGRKSGDMGVQILLLSFVQLGKFLNYYGHVDPASGMKGSRVPAANTCLLNYTHPTAMSAINNPAGSTGSCTTTNNGHSDMSGADLKRRLCEGSTLIANILDVIKNVDLSVSSDLSSLESVTTSVDQYRALATAAGVAHLIDLTSQSECETLLNTAAEMNNMQTYYAAVFEKQLK